MTEQVGLDRAFWEEFPDFGSVCVSDACARCADFADDLATLPRDAAAQRISVEYTQLFVGLPRPAAPPWETMYRGEGGTVGFGQATSDMRALLRAAGLELRNENNQYEDHIGIELLYLSVLCSRMAAMAAAEQKGIRPDAESAVTSMQIMRFAEDYPLSWIDKLSAAIAKAAPAGYYVHLLDVARSVVSRLRELLS